MNSESAEGRDQDAMHAAAYGGRANGFKLTPHQQEMLLQAARAAIRSYLQYGVIPQVRTNDPELRQPRGAFVTLRRRRDSAVLGAVSRRADEQLRGCVGRMQADVQLFLIVQEMAVRAATADPRFAPLTLRELDRVRIEISVLSDLEDVSSLDEIEIGVHGLLIDHCGRRGVLLPKVATERGWGRNEFLDHLFLKAGIPTTCWPGPANLYSFTAVDFGEPKSS